MTPQLSQVWWFLTPISIGILGIMDNFIETNLLIKEFFTHIFYPYNLLSLTQIYLEDDNSNGPMIVSRVFSHLKSMNFIILDKNSFQKIFLPKLSFCIHKKSMIWTFLDPNSGIVHISHPKSLNFTFFDQNSLPGLYQDL